jgi:hypothetical protein
MTLSTIVQLSLTTVFFLVASATAKSWAIYPNLAKLLIALIFYCMGNLIMFRLIREFGMAAAFSLTGLLQLIAVNAIAFTYFSESFSFQQTSGIVLAVIATGLIIIEPSKW